ncbi:MAG: hypothetical protein ABII00_11445 [Elusimicrobiota bacterium]
MPRDLLSTEKIRHVNDHLTPLAVLIVVPGLFVAPLSKLVLIPSAVLITYSVIFNYLSLYLMKRDITLASGLRVGSNYVVNICLLWLLYSVWPLVWVLLVLMSIGVAVYQNRRDSLRTGIAISILLLAVHWAYGGSTLIDWTNACVKACVIVLFNLFVNGLLQIASESAKPAAEEAAAG